MALPRSVKEVSKLDFLPRHCESEHFRGFSFIGEGFPLPERNVRRCRVRIPFMCSSNHKSDPCIQSMERDHYWNNCDEDGQSLSECASSVFDDDFGEIPAPEPTQEKKKRPPRKKKNKHPVPPLETTDEGVEHKEKNVVPTKDRVGGDQIVTAAAAPNKAKNTSPDVSETESGPISRGKSTHPIESEQPDELTQKLVPPSSTVHKSLNPDAKTWGGAAKFTQHVPLAIAMDQTCAGKTGKTHSSRVEIPVAAAATPPAVSLPRPRSPPRSPARGSDWTTHIVSRRGVQTQNSATQKIPTRPPPTAGQSGQISWPTLEGCPPPTFAKRAEPTPAKPTGVWGRPS